MEIGGFRDQGVEIGRFSGGVGWVYGSGGWRLVGLGVRWVGFWIRGWRSVGLVVEMGGFMNQGVEIGRFRDQGVEIGRFSGGVGWVYGSGAGDW